MQHRNLPSNDWTTTSLNVRLHSLSFSLRWLPVLNYTSDNSFTRSTTAEVPDFVSSLRKKSSLLAEAETRLGIEKGVFRWNVVEKDIKTRDDTIFELGELSIIFPEGEVSSLSRLEVAGRAGSKGTNAKLTWLLNLP